MDDHLVYARRANARMKAKSLGLDPDLLDWDYAEEHLVFNPNGTPKSIEISALCHLIAKRFYEQQASTGRKTKKGVSA